MRKKPLRILAQRIQAGNRQLSALAIRNNARVIQDLLVAIVGETRRSFTSGCQVLGHQGLVEIARRTATHRVRVGSRSTMAQQEHLLLRCRHLIVPVVLTQIRFLILQPAHGLLVHISALNVNDPDRFAVQIKGTHIYPDRRAETIPRLVSRSLQQVVNIVDADDVDPIPLRHAQQDHASTRLVRERAQRRTQLLRRVLREGLRLDRRGIAAAQLEHSQGTEQVIEIVDHRLDSIS